MTAGEKIKRHLFVHGLSQKQFAALSQIPESNLSLIVKDEREPTLTMAMRAAKVMECTVDDLMNDDLDYPLPKAKDRPRPLTAAEREVLDTAHKVSRYDAKPAQLTTALQRLLGLPLGLLGGAPDQPEPVPPTEGDGGKRRR